MFICLMMACKNSYIFFVQIHKKTVFVTVNIRSNVSIKNINKNTHDLYKIVNMFLCRHGLTVRCTVSESIQPYAYILLHIHTCTHARIHTHHLTTLSHIHMHTHMHTTPYSHTHTHIHVAAHMQTHALIAILAGCHAHTHIHTPRYFSCHAQIYTYHLTDNHALTYTHHLARNDTHIVYTHTNMYTHSLTHSLTHSPPV